MQARLKNPFALIPGALPAFLAIDKATEAANLPYTTRKLVHLRASQINACSVCVEMHARELKKAGETDERLFAVSAWRETPYFTEAERAALALVAHGAAPLGVVYATDARAEPGVKVVGVFPAGSHAPITYPVARLTASTHPDAEGFRRFLLSAEGKAIFRRFGFVAH